MIRFRKARLSDAHSLAEIYRPYVEKTSVTLEYDPPSDTEFEARIATISSEFPYIVCEANGAVIGYAYAHKYKERFGYRFCAELSIYVEFGHRKAGLGTRLYKLLIELLTEMGYKNLYGVVTDPNPGSFALHTALGFVEIGREHSAGLKLGEWHDVVIFERQLGDYPAGVSRECPKTIDDISEYYDRLLARAESE